MEPYIDRNLKVFRSNLDHHANASDAFDTKKLISFLVLDILGELALAGASTPRSTRMQGSFPPTQRPHLPRLPHGFDARNLYGSAVGSSMDALALVPIPFPGPSVAEGLDACLRGPED